MFAWIDAAIDAVAGMPATDLVIRVHPVEVRVLPVQRTRQRVDEWLRGRGGAAAHVRVVPPEHPASPYALMEMADLGLVYTSTAGLEMALRGQPVVVAGRAHYAGTELVHTPASREDWRALVRSFPGPRERQVELAERYAHLFYFEHPVSHEDLLQDGGLRGYRFTGDPARSRVLERAGI
jgi:hypothetical protein